MRAALCTYISTKYSTPSSLNETIIAWRKHGFIAAKESPVMGRKLTPGQTSKLYVLFAKVFQAADDGTRSFDEICDGLEEVIGVPLSTSSPSIPIDGSLASVDPGIFKRPLSSGFFWGDKER